MRLLRIPRAVRSGLATALVLAANPAIAAPFCLQTQSVPPQCIYYDAHECQLEANRQGGTCSVSTQEQAMLRPGEGQYCMVTSGGASVCAYPDIQSCDAAARSQNATCVEAPNVAPAKAPNPYSAVGGL
jgi:hypothetical protein